MNVNQYEIALQAEQWKVLYFPQTAHKRIGFAAKNMPVIFNLYLNKYI